MDGKALATSLVCLHIAHRSSKWQSIAFVKIAFFIKGLSHVGR